MATQDCYCINPHCQQKAHPDNNNPSTRYCLSCGSDLLLNNKYRVSRLLSGNSGFGLVYEVFEGFKTKILKVLLQRWNSEPKAIELFKREYDVLLALNRQGITGVPKVEDYFTYTTRQGISLYCLIMEKVEGINLEEWVKQNDKLSQKQALKWLREITLILDKIHQQNWFHRDIKPPNIMRRNSGELVLIDFGTAREETQTYYQKVQGQQLTGISSPGYTPNEQQHGQSVIQSDFFALGRTFVNLLTGKSPLDMYDAVNDVFNWREETENIHPLLLNFIEELMGRLPKDRPANTQVILQRLDEIERQLNQPPMIPPPQPPVTPQNPPPVVTQKQPPVIPNFNPSPPVSPVPVPKKSPVKPVKKNKLRNGIIAIGGVLLLGIGITQGYGYFSHKSSVVNLSKIPISKIPKTTPALSNDNGFAWLSQRHVTESDLQNKNGWELDIMRNSIYASYGRKFCNKELQEYFNQQFWYSPKYSPEEFPSNQLSKLEQENATFIWNYQDRYGLRKISKSCKH